MTADLFASIRAKLIAGKVHPDKVSNEWAFQRAWNEGIDFSLREIGKVEELYQCNTEAPDQINSHPGNGE